MIKSAIDEFFKSRGYSDRAEDPIYRKEGTVYWYRKVPETEHHQVVVRMWPSLRPDSSPSFEVEMTYETRDEVWANTKFYGLSFQDLEKHLTRLEARLKDALVYMDANPLHYRFDGRD